jgi:hypothetical protein
MPFTAVDPFAGVVAAAVTADGFRAAQALGVDHRRRRLPGAALDLDADLFAQAVVHPVEGAIGGPGFEVVVDQLVVREVDR